jgi:hypothetical protein
VSEIVSAVIACYAQVALDDIKVASLSNVGLCGCVIETSGNTGICM